MSPYLFVLVMEVFSGLMGNLVQNNDFKLHWHCERIHLTHLCFADDLMTFYQVEVGTISVIKSFLDQFQRLSRLMPNQDKSCMFIYGVEFKNKELLLDVLNYKEGKLPVKYPGIPLITTQHISSDCVILVDCIMAKVRSCMHCSLSYACRLQLIKSILLYSSFLSLFYKRLSHYLDLFYWKAMNLLQVVLRWLGKTLAYKGRRWFRCKNIEVWNRVAWWNVYLWDICTNLRHSI
jgi:hypothetical protein